MVSEVTEMREKTRLAFSRLGWLSSYTRQFVTSRQLLRSIGDISGEEYKEDQLWLLRLLRVCIFGISGSSSIQKQIVFAPYMPADRPTEHLLSLFKKDRVFSMRLTHQSIDKGGIFDCLNKPYGGFAIGNSYSVDDASILLEEIEVIRQGVRLTNKSIGDSNCDREFFTPLWRGHNSLAAKTTKKRLSSLAKASPTTWSFWLRWFEGFVEGKPIDRALQRKIALIETKIWEAGPEAVAEAIARIEAEHLLEQTPQAERVEFNSDSGKFRTVPIDVVKPGLLGATLSQVQDALEDVLANTGNGISETSREVRVLQRVVTKYGNDPQQIEMGFVSVHKGLARQILIEEDLPPSEENLALMDALEEGAKAIRATHPEVAENRKIINEQALREASPADLELLEDARPLLADISEPELADDWNTDIRQLINDATLPLPTGAPPLPGVDETQRIFSRVSKMKLKYDAVVKTGAKAFDSDGMKTARFGLTVGGALSALVGMGLRLLGLI